jgi:hypothetical protein
MMASTPTIARTVSVALLSLPLLVGSASAECAWVLWVIGENPGTASYPNWTPLKAFDTLKQCEQIRPLGQYESRCLRDTIDPRGPKGK